MCWLQQQYILHLSKAVVDRQYAANPVYHQVPVWNIGLSTTQFFVATHAPLLGAPLLSAKEITNKLSITQSEYDSSDHKHLRINLLHLKYYIPKAYRHHSTL